MPSLKSKAAWLCITKAPFCTPFHKGFISTRPVCTAHFEINCNANANNYRTMATTDQTPLHLSFMMQWSLQQRLSLSSPELVVHSPRWSQETLKCMDVSIWQGNQISAPSLMKPTNPKTTSAKMRLLHRKSKVVHSYFGESQSDWFLSQPVKVRMTVKMDASN